MKNNGEIEALMRNEGQKTQTRVTFVNYQKFIYIGVVSISI